MPRATLIFNESSGGSDRLKPEQILEALTKAGFESMHAPTQSEEDLDKVLRRAKGLVVVAGGDGSVRAVATRLINKKVPLAIVPMGTANNIARTLNIEGDPLEVIAGLSNPVKRHLDIGRVRAPWGTDYFLEAFGLGLYAETLAAYDPDKGKSVLRSITAINEVFSKFSPCNCKMWIDGQDISGEYLLVEVLNTTAFGPRIKVAPDADPSDGRLEVIRVQAENRDNFLTYFRSLLAEELDELPSVEYSSGKRVAFEWSGGYMHVDAEVRPSTEERDSKASFLLGAHRKAPHTRGKRVIVDVLPREIEIWVPQREAPTVDQNPEIVIPTEDERRLWTGL